MNSTIPADLHELKTRFETWRTNRKYLREPIPILAASLLPCLSLSVSVSAVSLWQSAKIFSEPPHYSNNFVESSTLGERISRFGIADTSVRVPVFIATSATREASAARNGTIVAQCRA